MMKFFSLLHIDNSGKKQSSNLQNSNSIKVYIDNAYFLAKTLFEKNGYRLNIVTNNSDLIVKYNSEILSFCDLIQIDFSIDVPVNARFYSAHYKIDVLKYFSNLDQNEYVGLIDLDILSANKFNEVCLDIFNQKKSLVYDITDQRVQAYGEETIIKDLSYIMGEQSIGKWYGGEFIFGTPSFFKKLVSQIDILYLNYCANLDELSHHGDEIIVSAAIENMIKNGEEILDVKNMDIIERYWSKKPKHKQKKLKELSRVALLHLPADKKFISDNCDLCLEVFFRKYKKYNIYRKLKGIIGDMVK